MNRVLCRWAALIGIGTLLFATLSVAAYACPMAAGAGSTAMAMPAGCPAHDQDTNLPNLCEAYCTADQQQTAQAAVDLPPLPLVHGLVATLFVSTAISPPAGQFAADATPTRTTSPPSTIRNCCFRL